MTPSLARMVLSKKGALSFPLKWYSIPQCWRYERMTRGRRRYELLVIHIFDSLYVWVFGMDVEILNDYYLSTSLDEILYNKKTHYNKVIPYTTHREHYQWNMDIWGVEGVEAEAELLSAIVTSFQDMGITSKDVGIKINSRKILTQLMSSLGVSEDKFAATCVLIDKLEKVPIEAIQGDLEVLGLSKEVVLELVASLQVLFQIVVQCKMDVFTVFR